MYHGGFIRNNNYIGGKFDYYDMVDKNRMSMIELDGIASERVEPEICWIKDRLLACYWK